jgi:hypothetical protein
MNLRVLSNKSAQITLFSLFLLTSIFAKSNESIKDPSIIISTKDAIEKTENQKTEASVEAEKKPAEQLALPDKIQFRTGLWTLDFGGKYVTENFFSNNMTTLNSKFDVDNVFYVRSTADYFFSMMYGDYKKPNLMFYNAFRFRFRWGAPTDAKNVDSNVNIAQVTQSVKGTATTRHLLWMREAWIKVNIGDLDLNNYFQAGLIPYQVGRGISLGAAYEALGFLGFVPGSSIDQFAPSLLLSLNPIKNRLIVDAYVALTENNQLSIDQNIEVIRRNEIGGCSQRGINRQSFIAALRSDIIVFEKDKKKINVEPYFVWQHAPDQDLELTNDVNTDIGTAGIAVEGIYKRFNWGLEGAVNFGEIDIRPLDRNKVVLSSSTIISPDTSFVSEIYDKIFAEFLLDGKITLVKAAASLDAAQIVNASTKDVSENGKYIGEYTTAFGETVRLFNAINRFRPEQRKSLQGYFFVADGSYDIIPNNLIVSFGVGYASGEVDPQLDGNKVSREKLLNQTFNGFIPLQSVYSGKRLRHLVLFNQGVPRFAVKNPLADLSLSNVTGVVVSDTINEMTNIAFVGGRIDWKIPQLKKYKFTVSQNVIPYFIPDPSSFVVSHPEDAFILLEQSSNYLGTELTTEWSALFYEKLKFSGYFGVLIPGQHYKDMCGTPVGKGKLLSGKDIAYVGNIQLSYLF